RISSHGFCITYHLKDLYKTEANHALPGSDVTLECTILNGDGFHVTQTQWSKIDDTPPSRIAVYHPTYAAWSDVNKTWSSHEATENHVQFSRWTLHLSNISTSLSGRYECSFATYPYGTKSAEIDLIIKAENETEYGMEEILLNQTLEIPCLKKMTSVNLSKSPLKWLMGENGRKETTLITKEFYHQYGNMTDSLLYKERIQLSLDNALKISPVKIVDDGKMFFCHVMYHPERILKSITQVKVFGKRFMTLPLFAFPKPNLTWYMDGEILKDQFGGMSTEVEVVKDGEEGLYVLSSVLRIQSTNQSATSQTFWCVCDFPFTGNKTLNISSEKIVVSSGRSSSLIMIYLKSKAMSTLNSN
uniref:Immunoglobulin domain-containing protein n=1 Tax=Pelusios castaneus TaxID=367368 RepID=A0A8C8R740_9SAUR